MSQVDDDFEVNPSDNTTFQAVVDARLSRRAAIGGAASAVAASLGGVGALLEAVPAEASGFHGHRPRPRLGFEAIPVSSEDKVTVPPGYTAKVLIAWGDPVSNGPAFRQDATNTAAEQAEQWGMHNDGMVYFPFFGRSDHGLLVQNHEYTDDVLLFQDGTANWNSEKTRKSLAAHGVGIVEVKKQKKLVRKGPWWWQWDVEEGWEVVRPSIFGRRITGSTPIRMGGPAAADPRVGLWAHGTLNNCAMGYTPWGTYLACEENFNGYFRVWDGSPIRNSAGEIIGFNNHPEGAHLNRERTALERRYGIDQNGFGYLWHTTDDRFDANKTPNEPNRFGWVTEINPFKPNSTPIKRTALGRIKHEGAWVQEARDGRVVVYTGDDQTNEYIYRYVSAEPWKKAFLRGRHPLDHGTLYVAKFNADGSGNWLPLTPDNPALAGWSMADILINTRGAADLLGATKMDRPEWIDTFPDRLTAIATLTNSTGSSGRGGASGPPVDAANPRGPNPYGHIIKWWYYHDWTENTFYWDHFALAGDPAQAHGSTINGDKYGSPDGIYVDPSDLIWIQTDVSGSTINTGAYAGFGNNQMLAAHPDTGETRRFLVGPRICEVTGVFMTPDRKTMFVGIQHPGEAPSGANNPANPTQFSSWPDGAAGQRPRSATVVITKDDGGVIGS